jgi:hypothetical protein
MKEPVASMRFLKYLCMVFLDLGPVASMKEPANKTIYLNQSLLQNDQDCKKTVAPKGEPGRSNHYMQKTQHTSL